MKITQVKITRSASPVAWYAHLIGKSFEVYKDRRDYILRADYDRGHKSYWRHISKDECVEVEGVKP